MFNNEDALPQTTLIHHNSPKNCIVNRQMKYGDFKYTVHQ